MLVSLMICAVCTATCAGAHASSTTCAGAHAQSTVAEHVHGASLLQKVARGQIGQGSNKSKKSRISNPSSSSSLFLGAPETDNPSYLAFSWKSDPSQPYLVGVGSKLFRETHDNVQKLIYRQVKVGIKETETVLDYAMEIATDNGLSGTLPIKEFPFPLSADANIKTMGSFEFQQFRYDKFIKAQFAAFTPKKLNRHDDLLPEVKQILLEAPFETVHAKLGEFYATKVEIGGVFQLTIATDLIGSATELGMDIGGKIDLFLASASLGVGGGVNTTVKGEIARTKLNVLGGDSSIWLKFNENHPSQTLQEEWASSVNDENAHPIGFTLIPIWDLLNNDDMNRQRAADLKTFITNKWRRANEQLPTYNRAPDPPDTCKDNVNIPGSNLWPTCLHGNMHSVRRRRIVSYCQCDTGYEPYGPFFCKKCSQSR